MFLKCKCGCDRFEYSIKDKKLFCQKCNSEYDPKTELYLLDQEKELQQKEEEKINKENLN